MQFSTVFKDLCKEKGVTQKKALADMGLGKSSNQKWVSGWPSFDTVVKVADYFSVSVDSLMRENGVTNTFRDANSSTIIQGSDGVTVNNGPSNISDGLTEQERELLRTFRELDPRTKIKAMTYLYELEDGMTK